LWGKKGCFYDLDFGDGEVRGFLSFGFIMLLAGVCNF